jgi:uncharacterized protein
MKNKLLLFASTLLLACVSGPNQVLEDIANDQLPAKKGSVNDLEDVLDAAQEAELSRILDSFQQASGKNIAILTTPGFGNYSGMDQYTAQVFNEWKMGENGLLIMLSNGQQSTFIEPGLRTTTFLNDTICQILVDSVMIPHFSNGNYFEGLRNGVYESILLWNALEKDSIR